MELERFILVIRKWLLLIVIGTLVAAGAAYWVSRIQTPIYSAKATLLLVVASTDANAEYAGMLGSDRAARTYSQLATSQSVLSEVAQSLKLDIPLPKLASMIKVSPLANTQLLEVVVEDTIPARAAAIANKLAEVFVKESSALRQAKFDTSREELKQELDQVEKQIVTVRVQMDSTVDPNDPTNAKLPLFARTELSRLQSQLTGLETRRTILLQSVEGFRLATASNSNNLVLSSPAQEPEAPVRPKIPMNTALAALAGLIIFTVLAFLIETLDDTVKSPEDISATIGVSVLGALATFRRNDGTSRLIAKDNPKSPISEAFRALRTNLQFSSVDKPLKTLLVTSANPQEGKSVIAANLAVVIAQAGLSVIVVDSDLRRPSQHHLFNLENTNGLTNALMEEKPDLERFLQPTEIENLKVITSGTLPPNPSELLGSERMKRLEQQLVSSADVVIFDSPPLGAVTDAALLANTVDGVLLIMEAGKTRRPDLVRAKADLDRVGAKILGLALNKLTPGARSYYHHYYYYHYYYYSDDGQRKRRKSVGRNPFSRLFKESDTPAGSAETPLK